MAKAAAAPSLRLKRKSAVKAQSSLAQEATESKKNRLAIQREKIMKLLDTRPGIWPDVTLMIETGYFDTTKKEVPEDTLPPCCNKWHLLSFDVIAKMLELGQVPQEIVDNLTKAEALKLLCFALNVNPCSAIHSKNIEKLTQMVTGRMEMLSYLTRLKPLKWADVVSTDNDNSTSLNYLVFGHYSLATWSEAEQKWRNIRHISGKTVKIPPMYTVTKEWGFVKNHHPIQAQLQHGFITIPIHRLFQDEGFEITPPEYAIQVGNAGRPVAARGRRSQGKSKAKAKAQALPDDLKIRLVLEEDGEVPAPPPGWGGAVPK